MTPRLPRPRSPLAHDRGEACGSCRDCDSCDGGRRAPRRYHVTPWGDRRCSVCADHGTRCLNLVKEPS